MYLWQGSRFNSYCVRETVTGSAQRRGYPGGESGCKKASRLGIFSTNQAKVSGSEKGTYPLESIAGSRVK